MKNLFIESRHAIDRISREKNVDAGVAVQMFISENDIDMIKHEKEFEVYQEIVRLYQTLDDHNLLQFFQGEGISIEVMEAIQPFLTEIDSE